jgi:MoaA/NifB/PqqE/SkfB family radical SAM enzyme
VPLLDVVLGYDCNLACTYCTISPEMRRRSLPATRVVQELERAARRGYRDVAFTGGEPTLVPELPALVRHARRLGFERAKVASNGLRYAHAPYLDHLVAAGVTDFHVSLHAPTDAAYDATVQLAGAAVHRAKALEHLVERGLDPVADLIVKVDTLGALRGWVADLRGRGLRRVALWLVSLTDHNRGRVEQLPRLTDVAAELRQVFDDARAHGLDAWALHVPRCFLPGYEEHVRHPGADEVTVVTPDGTFALRDSRLAGGVHVEACRGCRFEASCPGLRPDYVALHGDGEPRRVT